MDFCTVLEQFATDFFVFCAVDGHTIQTVNGSVIKVRTLSSSDIIICCRRASQVKDYTQPQAFTLLVIAPRVSAPSQLARRPCMRLEELLDGHAKHTVSCPLRITQTAPQCYEGRRLYCHITCMRMCANGSMSILVGSEFSNAEGAKLEREYIIDIVDRQKKANVSTGVHG